MVPMMVVVGMIVMGAVMVATDGDNESEGRQFDATVAKFATPSAASMVNRPIRPTQAFGLSVCS